MKTFIIPTSLLKQIGQNSRDLPKETLGMEIVTKTNNMSGFYPKTFILENGEIVFAV